MRVSLLCSKLCSTLQPAHAFVNVERLQRRQGGGALVKVPIKLERRKQFLCLPPQELTDLEIFAPSNTRITFKLTKWDMSYHNQLFLCVIIPRYLYVINDSPCYSAYAAKRLNKRSLLLILLLLQRFTDFFTDFERKTDCFAV